MILEAAIVNLTRNLDILSLKDKQGISSHVKLKEEGLSCLISLLENAPVSEFTKLLQSRDHEILLGYLINVLCQLAKNDPSKAVRIQSLNIILTLVSRLENLHNINPASDSTCSITPIQLALPGVSSTLFRLIMSDTKLPRNLLVVATKTLVKFITITFQHCEHKRPITQNSLQLRKDEKLEETCDNLAVRLSFLIDYITMHSSDLPLELKYEVFNLCDAIVNKTKIELISRSLKSIVKYTAFISSKDQCPKDLNAEVQLRIMIIFDNIRDRIQNCDNACDQLDSVVISCLFNLLDNLEQNCFSMLLGERQSELSMLCGFLKLLPRDSLTTFLEIPEKQCQIIKILTELTEFTTDQPYLFLADVTIDDKALETCNEKIYTIEKRFAHLNEKEISLISDCCRIIGQNLDWLCLNDILKNRLSQFSSSSNLFITHLFLQGCLVRSDNDSGISRFTMPMIEYYLDRTHEEYVTCNESLKADEAITSQAILKIVIAIEMLITLVELHTKFTESRSEKIIILKSLLCPILNWASSNSRAISQASLNALAQISHSYGLSSTKSLIEENIDYVVDGVAQSLENFGHNPEVTSVLALTFKLSSIENFYYFRDVYERVFKTLGAYHHTDKSKSIALLLYRTLSILSEWKDAKSQDGASSNLPLKSESSVKSVIQDIDINRRLKKLHSDMMETNRLRRQIEDMQVTEEDENKIVKEIESGRVTQEMHENKEAKQGDDTKKKDKPIDIELTEKILTHCVNLISSNNSETKILALKTAACGFKVLRDDENTLLPLVHQLWGPLVSRLTGDYSRNLEINLCAFECLVSMAERAKDFIKGRTLDSIMPRLCLFLESQANQSKEKNDYGPYCMTIAYKCQLRILTHLGALAYHIELAYSSLWRVVRAALIYLDPGQVPSLREAARASLHYMIALDADCVWYYAKKAGQLNELPFELIYDTNHCVVGDDYTARKLR